MIRSVLYFFITSIVCVILLELYIRGTEISAVSETDYHKEIGRIIRPNAKLVHYNENFTYSQINKYGYLGPSYSPKKSPETFRIALLGDSYVEGFQVLDRHHFRTVLEENLKEELGYEQIEILNFGRSGFGLEDTYAYDRNFVSDFNPDLKIYLLSAIDFYRSSQDELLPKWKLNNDKLVLDTSYRKSTTLRVYNTVKIGLQNSATLQMLRNCVNIIRDGKAADILFGKLAYLFQEREKDPMKNDNKRKQIVAKELPEIPEAILEELGDERNVVIANRDSIQFPQHLLDEIRQEGISIINLADTLAPLKNQKEIDPRYWPVTDTRGHWNYTGHKAVGEYLSRILSEKINPKSVKKLGFNK